MAAINLCWSSDDDEQPAQAIDLTMSTDSNEDEVEDEIVTLDPAQDAMWMELARAQRDADAKFAAAEGGAAARFEIIRNKNYAWLEIFMGIENIEESDNEDDGGSSTESSRAQQLQRQILAQSFCVAGSDITDRVTRDQLAKHVDDNPQDIRARSALKAFDERLEELEK
jgi:hypothetical protein